MKGIDFDETLCPYYYSAFALHNVKLLTKSHISVINANII